MSKIDEYSEALKEHKEMVKFLEETADGGCYGRIAYNPYLNIVQFSRTRSEKDKATANERFAKFLAFACKEVLPDLVKQAIEISKDDVVVKFAAAQDESINFIKAAGVKESQEEREEDHANETE